MKIRSAYCLFAIIALLIFVQTLRQVTLLEVQSESRRTGTPAPVANFSLTPHHQQQCKYPSYNVNDMLPSAKDESATFQPDMTRPKYMVGCNAKGWGSYIMREFYYLLLSLSEMHQWIELKDSDLTKPGIFTPAANQTFQPPLAVFICETSVRRLKDLPVAELRKQGTIFLAWGDDLQMYNRFSYAEMKSYFQNLDVMVSTYAYKMDVFFGKVTKQMLQEANEWNDNFQLPSRLWSPHSASPEFVEQPFNDSPHHQLFLSGAQMPKIYPQRAWFANNYAKVFPKTIHIHKHPGYKTHPESQTLEYAQKINSYEFGVTCTSAYRYVVAKVFEIPATGSLLLVNLDLEPVLAALGMRDLEHYVGYHDQDPVPRIQWALDPQNAEIITKIRKQGQQLVQQKHTPLLRAKAIDDYVVYRKVTYEIPQHSWNCVCPSLTLPFDECVSIWNSALFSPKE